jgi:hypothetical protein
MRRLRPQEKKRVGGFRLLRFLPMEVNVRRLHVFVKRIKRRLWKDTAMRRIGMKNRRRARAAAGTWHR